METVSDVLQPKMMVRMIVRSNDTPENYQTIENVQMNSIVYGLTLRHLPTTFKCGRHFTHVLFLQIAGIVNIQLSILVSYKTCLSSYQNVTCFHHEPT
jgi:hypothetical protein